MAFFLGAINISEKTGFGGISEVKKGKNWFGRLHANELLTINIINNKIFEKVRPSLSKQQRMKSVYKQVIKGD